MKFVFSIVFLLSCTISLPILAQQVHITSPNGGMDAYRKIKKDVYDTAKIAVYYDLKFLKDSTKTGDYTKAKTILQISDKYAKYGDYYMLMLDSLEGYLSQSKKNSRDQQVVNAWYDAIKRTNYRTVSITDLSNYQTKVQTYDILYAYEYTFEPKIEWNLEEGDTLISGIPCKKAVCHYAGRDYTAWYAACIHLPYGPYIFNGLPGLIIDIRDKKDNWVFTYAGMEKARSFRDMYLYQKEFIEELKKTSREQALTAIRNDTENYDNLFIEVADVKEKVNGKWVTPEANYPRRPSNMLELEW